MLHKISLDTLAPLSFLGVLAGGVFWLTSVIARVDALASAQTKQESFELRRQDSDERMKDLLHNIDIRLTRIEQKLGVK